MTGLLLVTTPLIILLTHYLAYLIGAAVINTDGTLTETLPHSAIADACSDLNLVQWRGVRNREDRT